MAMVDSGETIGPETIRARVKLPCSVRLNGSELRIARGVAEELTRESVIVVMPASSAGRWLEVSAKVSIALELPCSGAFGPRILECAATVQHVRKLGINVHVLARVERMAIVSHEEMTKREAGAVRSSGRYATHSCAVERAHVAVHPRDNNPVIRRNHRTNLNSKATGEQTMSFLKNFFIEEDGQDMVEYGLVISLVVIGGVVAYQNFSGTINNGINAVGSSIKNNL